MENDGTLLDVNCLRFAVLLIRNIYNNGHVTRFTLGVYEN